MCALSTGAMRGTTRSVHACGLDALLTPQGNTGQDTAVALQGSAATCAACGNGICQHKLCWLWFCCTQSFCQAVSRPHTMLSCTAPGCAGMHARGCCALQVAGCMNQCTSKTLLLCLLLSTLLLLLLLSTRAPDVCAIVSHTDGLLPSASQPPSTCAAYAEH